MCSTMDGQSSDRASYLHGQHGSWSRFSGVVKDLFGPGCYLTYVYIYIYTLPLRAGAPLRA